MSIGYGSVCLHKGSRSQTSWILDIVLKKISRTSTSYRVMENQFNPYGEDLENFPVRPGTVLYSLILPFYPTFFKSTN